MRQPSELQSNRFNFTRAPWRREGIALISRGSVLLFEETSMSRLPLFALAAALALGFAAGPASEAQAKGCLKGALVGGVAGHYAGHHAVAGAIGGCIVGHHVAAVNAEKQKQLEAQPTPTATPK